MVSKNIISEDNMREFHSINKILRRGKFSYDSYPVNCSHIRISYLIWTKKGNSNRDPTEIGRKIKQLSKIVSDI